MRTTRPDEQADRHPDLVDRAFVTERPNALWVTDLTHVPTWSGVVYVCFIVDAFSRMIVGWRATTNMRTTMVLDALEMARWSRSTTLEGWFATAMPAASSPLFAPSGDQLLGDIQDEYGGVGGRHRR